MDGKKREGDSRSKENKKRKQLRQKIDSIDSYRFRFSALPRSQQQRTPNIPRARLAMHTSFSSSSTSVLLFFPGLFFFNSYTVHAFFSLAFQKHFRRAIILATSALSTCLLASNRRRLSSILPSMCRPGSNAGKEGGSTQCCCCCCRSCCCHLCPSFSSSSFFSSFSSSSSSP